jgi:uncharacterized protein (DUF58 family)
MRFLWFLCLIFVSALVFFYYDKPFVWVMSAALFLMPLVSFILRLVASRFAGVVFRAPDETARAGEEFDVCIDFENRSFIPIPLLTAEVDIHSAYSEETRTASLSLAGKSGGRLIFRISAPHCSVVLVKIKGIFSSSYSKGIYKSINHNADDLYIPVIPKRKPPENGALPSAGLTERRINDIIAAKRARSGEFSDIRLFADGDRESRIHWKLSAKSEELLVRDFSAAVVPNVLLLINPPDVSVTPPDETDRIFENARRFALLLSDEGIPCSFILSGYDTAPRSAKNIREIERALEGMIMLLFTKEKTDELSRGNISAVFDIILVVD